MQYHGSLKVSMPSPGKTNPRISPGHIALVTPTLVTRTHCLGHARYCGNYYTNLNISCTISSVSEGDTISGSKSPVDYQGNKKEILKIAQLMSPEELLEKSPETIQVLRVYRYVDELKPTAT